MKGFFELPTQSKGYRGKALHCGTCGLYKSAKSPHMPYTGKGRLKAFILAEANGKTEDEQNKQFVGDAGQFLRSSLKALGFQLDRDFWKQNSVRCRPMDAQGRNRAPTNLEQQCCMSLWRKEMDTLKPKFIFLLGAKAVEIFYGNQTFPITSDLSIGRWARTCVPHPKIGAWVISLYHPSFFVRSPEHKPRFIRDLEWGIQQLKREPPQDIDWKERTIQVVKHELVVELLQNFAKNNTPIAIDYETSGLRPYKEGHHIWSIGIYRIGDTHSYAFPYSYPNHWSEEEFKKIESLMQKILSNPMIPKIAQAIQMEEAWSRRIIGTPVQGWVHDTMICSHIINEHRKFTSLDFQVFINWGFEYGEDMTLSKKADVSGFNHMHKVPLKSLLQYNALDSLFTGLLHLRQKEII